MFRVSDTIRRTGTPDGGILLDVHHGRMFFLNVIGAKILEFLQQDYDPSRIAQEISKEYAIGIEVVRVDVTEFIEHLHKHHILETVRSTEIT